MKQKVINLTNNVVVDSEIADSFVASMSDVDDKGFLFFLIIVGLLLYLSFQDVSAIPAAKYLEDAALEAHLEWAFGY